MQNQRAFIASSICWALCPLRHRGWIRELSYGRVFVSGVKDGSGWGIPDSDVGLTPDWAGMG